jgi:hypothetical protein
MQRVCRDLTALSRHRRVMFGHPLVRVWRSLAFRPGAKDAKDTPAAHALRHGPQVDPRGVGGQNAGPDGQVAEWLKAPLC